MRNYLSLALEEANIETVNGFIENFNTEHSDDGVQIHLVNAESALLDIATLHNACNALQALDATTANMGENVSVESMDVIKQYIGFINVSTGFKISLESEDNSSGFLTKIWEAIKRFLDGIYNCTIGLMVKSNKGESKAIAAEKVVQNKITVLENKDHHVEPIKDKDQPDHSTESNKIIGYEVELNVYDLAIINSKGSVDQLLKSVEKKLNFVKMFTNEIKSDKILLPLKNDNNVITDSYYLHSMLKIKSCFDKLKNIHDNIDSLKTLHEEVNKIQEEIKVKCDNAKAFSTEAQMHVKHAVDGMLSSTVGKENFRWLKGGKYFAFSGDEKVTVKFTFNNPNELKKVSEILLHSVASFREYDKIVNKISTLTKENNIIATKRLSENKELSSKTIMMMKDVLGKTNNHEITMILHSLRHSLTLLYNGVTLYSCKTLKEMSEYVVNIGGALTSANILYCDFSESNSIKE